MLIMNKEDESELTPLINQKLKHSKEQLLFYFSLNKS